MHLKCYLLTKQRKTRQGKIYIGSSSIYFINQCKFDMNQLKTQLPMIDTKIIVISLTRTCSFPYK